MKTTTKLILTGIVCFVAGGIIADRVPVVSGLVAKGKNLLGAAA